jgi:hypothetical protein
LLSTGVILPDGEVAWFSAGGKLETMAAETEQHLAVVVERTPGGPQELWTWQQFREYVTKAGGPMAVR